MKIGLDTNVFLNVKNKEDPFYQYSNAILEAVDDGKLKANISIITIAELCVGYYKENELKEKDEFISSLYSNQYYRIIDLNLKIADKSGEIKYKTKLKLPDCVIIASLIQEGVSCLITNDSRFDKAKDFISIYKSEEFYKNFITKNDK